MPPCQELILIDRLPGVLMRKIYAMVLVSALLAACSPGKLNEKVVSDALQAHWNKRPDKCELIDVFPLEVPRRAQTNAESGPVQVGKHLNTAKMAALEKAGLVRGESLLNGAGVHTMRYTLTKQGESHYQEIELTDLVSGRSTISGWLCYGKIRLRDGVEWKAPYVDANTNYLVSVDYRITFEDVPDWALKPEFLSAFPEIERELVPGPNAKLNASLVNRNGEWVVAPDMLDQRTRQRRIK